jgi:mono/diheme cytochrome c family protein
MTYLKTLPATLAWSLGLCVFTGCDNLPGKPDPAKKFVPPAKVLDFALLYHKNCAGCHGKDGKFGPAPPLNDPVFLTIVPDVELIKTLTFGRPGTEMPAFAKEQGGTLTVEQIQVLAAGMKKRWGKPDGAQQKWPPYLPPADKGDAWQGQIVFAKACAVCHGDKGAGTDGVGPINDPAFLNLASAQVLRRYVITGRPDLGMPNCLDGSGRSLDFTGLTSAEVNDVVALLLSWKQPARDKK